MIKNILITTLILLLGIVSKAQTIYESVQTGNWEDLATWTTVTYSVVFVPPSGYTIVPTYGPATTPPTSADYVTIKDNHTVTINSAATARVTTMYSTAVTTPAKIVVTTGNSLTSDTVSFYPTGTGLSQVENNGTVTAVKTSFTLSSAGAVGEITNNSTYRTTNTVFDETQGTARIIINTGGIYRTDDVQTKNTSPTNTVFDLSSGTGVLRIRGNFTTSTGNHPSIIGGTAGSKVEYRGTSAQTINTSFPEFVFCDLRVFNPAGASLDAPLTTVNLKRDLGVFSSGVFNQNAQSIDVARNLIVNTSNSTFTSNASLNVVNRLTNKGTFNMTGGNILNVGQDLVNTGTFNGNGTINITRHFTNDNGNFVSTGCNINVQRNWSNSGGTYTYHAGDIVTLNGTTGNCNFFGTTEFYELVVDKSGKRATVGSGDIVNIKGFLTINAGDFRVTTGEATLLSDASGTAQLEAIASGASFTGSLNVQRYLALGNDGWREVTSPVQGTTLLDWQNDGIVFSGFTGADYDGSTWYSWVNSYTYNEPNANGVKADGWVATTNITNPTSFTNGHRIYMGNGGAMTATLSVKGVPNTGLQAVNITNGGTGASDVQNGWNLIGNPYPCTIDWNGLATSNTESAYWIWNATAGNYGVYQTGGATGTNGVDRYIAHSQAFWVHATASTGSIIFQESNKVRVDKAFVKSYIDEDFVRVKLTGNVNPYSDEVIISFSNEATENFDNEMDRNKMFTELTDEAPTLTVMSQDGLDLSIACVNEYKTMDIPLKAYAGSSAYGTYTIEFDIPNNKLVSACVTLEDLETGTITDVKSTPSYTFTTTANSPEQRFILHVVQPFETQVTSVSCASTMDGQIEVSGSGVAGETFILMNGATSVDTLVADANGVVTFGNLPAGTYTLNSSIASNCGASTFDIVINQPVELVAQFELDNDVLYLDGNATVTPTNTSNGSQYYWDFGDGVTSIDVNPTHTYTSAGIYVITLTVENGSCSETTTQTVEVRATTGIEEAIRASAIEVISTNGFITININTELSNAKLILLDVNGRKVKEQMVQSNKIILSTTDMAKGMYLINIQSAEGNLVEKCMIR